VTANAPTLDFPSSVVQYFRGEIGTPPLGGFPEPLRTHVLKGAPSIVGRPGASLQPFDFEKARLELTERFNQNIISEVRRRRGWRARRRRGRWCAWRPGRRAASRVALGRSARGCRDGLRSSAARRARPPPACLAPPC
jgi:hypothetical protein